MKRPFTPILALLSGTLLPSIASAQDCGAADQPCAVTDGTYHIALPTTNTPTGIVVHLHGGGGTGKGMLNSGLANAALERGYLVVAPNGEHPENQWSRDWSVKANNMTFARDDIGFLTDVMQDVRATHDVSDVPVLLAGFSRGASMTWNVACQMPDFADAYAPAAGAFWDDLPETCAGPVRLFHTHGWTDRVVPLEGRSFDDGSVVQGDVWASLKIMRETNGCRNRQPESSSFDGDTWFRHWTDCDAGQIDLMLHQGGHGAPGNWGNIILDWFES